MKQKPIVAVGMSGGVDSSVAALLLQQSGYDVFGLFMKNWEEEKAGECTTAQDHADALSVCERLSIPLYTVNFCREYQENVFQRFLAELALGRTPNPDILCNSEIKFDLLLDKALRLGADHLATGHYCRLERRCGLPALCRGRDANKDQTYFLHAVDGAMFEKVLFPIGNLHKEEVRRLAQLHGLGTAAKRDSTGICFIGKRDFKQFVSQYVAYNPGEMVTPKGEHVGTHDGVAYYTIGQRRGLNIGGAGAAWFVVGKDIVNNRLIVVQGEDHPALYSTRLLATDARWVRYMPSFPFSCTCKIRYRQSDVVCRVDVEGSTLYVHFDTPQRAVTPGQAVVFYDGDECLGGATIL